MLRQPAIITASIKYMYAKIYKMYGFHMLYEGKLEKSHKSLLRVLCHLTPQLLVILIS